MTAFASVNGSLQDLSWAWEIRSVNGRGLDVKIRLPDGYDALEPIVRKQISARCKRGSIAVGLKLKRVVSAKAAGLNPQGLKNAIAAAQATARAAEAEGLPVAPLDVVGVLALSGVFGYSDAANDVPAEVMTTLQADLQTAVAAFVEARAAEGTALGQILTDQIGQIEDLYAQASDTLQARRDHVADALRTNVARVLEQTDAVDEARIAQELAIIAVKADVAEELDRLGAHVCAARDLLAAKGPIGRKFDFLTQEFNREANTLCSKANFTSLTRIGLDLKTVIDQMREQVQNVE